MTHDLPEGWARAPLAQVIDDLQAGFASGEKNVKGGLPHLRMNNIALNGKLDLSLLRTVPKRLAGLQHYLQLGDVLVCTTNSGKLVGKCAHFDLEGEYAFSNHLTRIRPTPDLVDGRFLRWNLWLHWQSGAIQERCKHWVNQCTLPKDVLLEMDVAIPPLPEQRRVVEKLEKLLSRVDTCQKRLEKIPMLLKRLRHSVLTAACSGRLTADWREENEGALARERWSLTTDPLGSLSLPKLPETWAWRKLGDISERVSVGHVGPTSKFYCDSRNGIPLVRSQNVRPMRLALEDVRYITEEFHSSLKKSELRAGDLLIVRVGANRGNTCRVPEGVTPLNCANVVFARPFSGISDFLEHYCQSKPGQELMLEMTTGSAQGVINTKAIAELPVPIPPESEQVEIMQRVRSLFALCDQLEVRFDKAHRLVGQLTPCLLAKAFRGELVRSEAELALRREARA